MNILEKIPISCDAPTVLAAHAVEIRRLGKHIVGDIIEIRRLTICQNIIGPGGWYEWLDRELGWSPQTALNFTRVFQLAETKSSKNFLDLNLPVSALYLLARPSTSDEVREDVIERARAGERITVAEVKEVVEQAATDSPVEKEPPVSDLPGKKPGPPKAPAAGSNPTLTTKSEKAGRTSSPGDEALFWFTASFCELRRRISSHQPDRFVQTTIAAGDLNKLGNFLKALALLKIGRNENNEHQPDKKGASQ